MKGPRRVIGGVDSEARRIELIDAARARRKAGTVPAEPERIVTPALCGRCMTENHEACDGGAWDIEKKPVPCVCSMEGHHPQRWGGSAVIVGGVDDYEADRRGAADEDRHWASHGGAA